jgi:hypothetical protein
VSQFEIHWFTFSNFIFAFSMLLSVADIFNLF